MNKVIFHEESFVEPGKPTNIKITIPSGFKGIKNTGLVKSILDFGKDIYANVRTIDMPKNTYSYKSKEILALSFWEPFDSFGSMSVIQIWGEGINEAHATKNLLKKLNNLYPYEDLLRASYYVTNNGTEKYKYFIYDPQEAERYNSIKAYMGNLGSRVDLMPCGYIYTNAILKQR